MKKRTTKTLEMLPTLLTLGNLFSGFLAIAKLTDSLHSTAAAQRIDLYTQAIWYVFVAMIFDAVDGKVARMFGAASEFGSQIDSLSDVDLLRRGPRAPLQGHGRSASGRSLAEGGADSRRGVPRLRGAASRALQRRDDP